MIVDRVAHLHTIDLGAQDNTTAPQLFKTLVVDDSPLRKLLRPGVRDGDEVDDAKLLLAFSKPKPKFSPDSEPRFSTKQSFHFTGHVAHPGEGTGG